MIDYIDRKEIRISQIWEVSVPLFNSGDPDQTTCFAASDLGVHCLPMSHKNLRDAMVIWIKPC